MFNNQAVLADVLKKFQGFDEREKQKKYKVFAVKVGNQEIQPPNSF
jgi:hypothetical protein